MKAGPSSSLYRNLRGELYVALERLARQFDETRGVNPFTYFERTLPPAVRINGPGTENVYEETKSGRTAVGAELLEGGSDGAKALALRRLVYCPRPAGALTVFQACVTERPHWACTLLKARCR